MIFVSSNLQILEDDYICDNDLYMKVAPVLASTGSKEQNNENRDNGDLFQHEQEVQSGSQPGITVARTTTITTTTNNRDWRFWGERWHNGQIYRRLDIKWYCWLRLSYENYIRTTNTEISRLIAEGRERKLTGSTSEKELEVLRIRVKRLQEVATLSKRQFDIIQGEVSFLGDSRAINAELIKMGQMVKSRAGYSAPVSGQIAVERLRERLEDNRGRLKQEGYKLPLALCLPVGWGLTGERLERYLATIAQETTLSQKTTIESQTTIAQSATVDFSSTIDFNTTLVSKLPMAYDATIAQKATVEAHATKSNGLWRDCACHQGLIIESKANLGWGEPLLRTRAEVEIVVEMLINNRLRLTAAGLGDFS